MLQVSNRAAAYLDETRRAAGLPESAGIRLSVHAGTGGQALRAAFARAPDDGDQVIERDGAKVFVSSDLHDVVTSHVLKVEKVRSAAASRAAVPGGQRLVREPRLGRGPVSVPRTPPDSPDVHPAEAPLEDPDDGAAEPDELPDPELVPG